MFLKKKMLLNLTPSVPFYMMWFDFGMEFRKEIKTFETCVYNKE